MRRQWLWVVSCLTALALGASAFLGYGGDSPTTAPAPSTSHGSPAGTRAVVPPAAASAPADAGSTAASVTVPRPAPESRPIRERRPRAIDTHLTRAAHGAEAVRVLGDALPAVAANAHLTGPELEAVLRSDPTAWVSPAGAVFYQEEVPTGPTSVPGFTPPSGSFPAPYPLADTFALHSLPGSTHAIYLDFDGVDVTDTMMWHTQAGLPSGRYAGWDPSGDGVGTFSDAERAAVQEIWAKVAEDYAAFDVDVTTADPGREALSMGDASDTRFGTHVVITGSPTPAQVICRGGCGGVTWVGVINAPVNTALGCTSRGPDCSEVAWVFPDALFNDPASVAEAAAHEAGHSFGLVHDGDSTTGDSYYAPDDGEGTRVWAAIMGAAYYNAVSQWSKADYPNAHNWTTVVDGGEGKRSAQIPKQDDVQIIRGIAGTRPTPASSLAFPLAVTGQTDYITSSTDAAYYALGTCGPGATVSADGAAVGGDLDIELSVLDASSGDLAPGTTAANPTTSQRLMPEPTGLARDPSRPGAQPADEVASDLGAGVTIPQTGGPYVAVVRGGGNLGGDWAIGGYDNYASLGAYQLHASGCTLPDVAVGLPGAPRAVSALTTDAGTTVTWSPPASDGGSAVTGYIVRIGGTEVSLPPTASSHTDTAHAGGSQAVSVTATNGVGEGPATTLQSTWLSAPGPVVHLAAGVEARSGTLRVTWSEPEVGQPITGYDVILSRAGTVLDREPGLPADTIGMWWSGLPAGLYAITVVAHNDQGSSATSVTATMPAYVVPRVPSAPKASIKAGPRGGKKTVIVSWRPGSAGTKPIAGYQVTVYSLKKGRARIAKRITARAGLRRIQVRLPAKKGRTYAVAVRARNAVGWSPLSSRTKRVTPR